MKRSLSLQGLLWSKKAVAEEVEEEEKDNRKTSFATLSTFGVS